VSVKCECVISFGALYRVAALFFPPRRVVLAVVEA
jgi:hypothetical protein